MCAKSLGKNLPGVLKEQQGDWGLVWSESRAVGCGPGEAVAKPYVSALVCKGKDS